MIIKRSDWAARATPPARPMPGLAVSVTAHHPSPHALPAGASRAQEAREMRAIQTFHIDGNGWKDIGYNFVITQNGNVYEGRGWGKIGAHAGTNVGNETSIGVAFMVNGKVEAPNAAALQAFKELRAEGVRHGFLTPGHVLKFHNEWHATDCPGKVAEAVLRAAEERHAPRVLVAGTSGGDVKELQRLLGMPADLQTGFFGRLTTLAVRNFQHGEGLEVDAIVGPKTLAKLREKSHA